MSLPGAAISTRGALLEKFASASVVSVAATVTTESKFKVLRVASPASLPALCTISLSFCARSVTAGARITSILSLMVFFSAAVRAGRLFLARQALVAHQLLPMLMEMTLTLGQRAKKRKASATRAMLWVLAGTIRVRGAIPVMPRSLLSCMAMMPETWVPWLLLIFRSSLL